MTLKSIPRKQFVQIILSRHLARPLGRKIFFSSDLLTHLILSPFDVKTSLY